MTFLGKNVINQAKHLMRRLKRQRKVCTLWLTETELTGCMRTAQLQRNEARLTGTAALEVFLREDLLMHIKSALYLKVFWIILWILKCGRPEKPSAILGLRTRDLFVDLFDFVVSCKAGNHSLFLKKKYQT